MIYVSLHQFPQEPRHLQLIADIEDSNVFSLVSGKKLYNAPSDYGFCIKVIPYSSPTPIPAVIIALKLRDIVII